MVGRGAAYADIDGDGDLDVLFTGIGQAPRLLRNDQQQNNHWLRFKLVGTRVNRDAIGAAVEVELADGRTLHRQVAPTRSYLSQVELPVTFGLGNVDRVHRVTVTWPDGSQQEVRISQVDRTYEIKQDTSPPRDREVGAAHSETYGNLSETHLPPLSELGASPQGPTSPLPGDASESASDSADSQIADFRSQIVLTSTTGSNNPQSAIRNPQLTHASCGSHLHLDLLTQYDQYPSQEPVPGSLPGRPCRGPSCSKGPGQQPGQAPTAPRLSDQGQSLLFAARDVPPSERSCRNVSPQPAGLAPRLDEGGIFRPPRLS
jgi:hypothetical protein